MLPPNQNGNDAVFLNQLAKQLKRSVDENYSPIQKLFTQKKSEDKQRQKEQFELFRKFEKVIQSNREFIQKNDTSVNDKTLKGLRNIKLETFFRRDKQFQESVEDLNKFLDSYIKDNVTGNKSKYYFDLLGKVKTSNEILERMDKKLGDLNELLNPQKRTLNLRPEPSEQASDQNPASDRSISSNQRQEKKGGMGLLGRFGLGLVGGATLGVPGFLLALFPFAAAMGAAKFLAIGAAVVSFIAAMAGAAVAGFGIGIRNLVEAADKFPEAMEKMNTVKEESVHQFGRTVNALLVSIAGEDKWSSFAGAVLLAITNVEKIGQLAGSMARVTDSNIDFNKVDQFAISTRKVIGSFSNLFGAVGTNITNADNLLAVARSIQTLSDLKFNTANLDDFSISLAKIGAAFTFSGLGSLVQNVTTVFGLVDPLTRTYETMRKISNGDPIDNKKILAFGESYRILIESMGSKGIWDSIKEFVGGIAKLPTSLGTALNSGFGTLYDLFEKINNGPDFSNNGLRTKIRSFATLMTEFNGMSAIANIFGTTANVIGSIGTAIDFITGGGWARDRGMLDIYNQIRRLNDAMDKPLDRSRFDNFSSVLMGFLPSLSFGRFLQGLGDTFKALGNITTFISGGDNSLLGIHGEFVKLGQALTANPLSQYETALNGFPRFINGFMSMFNASTFSTRNIDQIRLFVAEISRFREPLTQVASAMERINRSLTIDPETLRRNMMILGEGVNNFNRERLEGVAARAHAQFNMPIVNTGNNRNTSIQNNSNQTVVMPILPAQQMNPNFSNPYGNIFGNAPAYP